jgi:RNA polymerase sigma factor (sigma-70 family)
VRRYQRPIISLIARMTRDRALAEDLAQETFVKAFRSLAAFDTTRRLSSWLFRIAHNTALDALRRSNRPANRGEGADDPAAPSEPDPVDRAAVRGRPLIRRDWERSGCCGGDGPIARAPGPEGTRAAADRLGVGPALDVAGSDPGATEPGSAT